MRNAQRNRQNAAPTGRRGERQIAACEDGDWALRRKQLAGLRQSDG